MNISENAETIRKSFTEQAKNFETKSMNFSKQEYLEYTVSCINPRKKDKVLEVAAGTCACGRAIAPFVQDVTCLDLTPAMLAVGKDLAEKQELCNMNYVLGDAEQMPFLDCSFDIVISRLAFHHFLKPDHCFAEMARVLKPGGKLVVIDMEATEESLREIQDKIETLRDPSHIKNLSKGEFEAMFVNNHLIIENTNTTQIPVSLTAWLNLTNASAKVSTDISKCFTDEIEGGQLTGFMPYRKDGEIYFNQRWLMVIGKKIVYRHIVKLYFL